MGKLLPSASIRIETWSGVPGAKDWLHWPIDRTQWSALALGIPGFPTTYLVGRDGIIRDAWVGARAWADPATQAAIASRADMD
jgi:hypothetical protein